MGNSLAPAPLQEDIVYGPVAPCWILNHLPDELFVEILLFVPDFAQRYHWKLTCLRFYKAYHQMHQQKSNEDVFHNINLLRVGQLSPPIDHLFFNGHEHYYGLLTLSTLDCKPRVSIHLVLCNHVSKENLIPVHLYESPRIWFDHARHYLEHVQMDPDGSVVVSLHGRFTDILITLVPVQGNDPIECTLRLRDYERTFYRNYSWKPSLLVYNILLAASGLIIERGGFLERLSLGKRLQRAIDHFPFGWIEQVCLLLRVDSVVAEIKETRRISFDRIETVEK